MSRTWTVETNTGSRAQIVTGTLRQQVWRPLTMSRDYFLRILPNGIHLDEVVLRNKFGIPK
jgi:hypothetical protein